ncbi:hypothetical protein dsmv_0396 [Desulfococcus multivorans DSM 2059]|jgi:hypothetical protein|uniref:Uncharacterized protein n=1 Tax=Desulfococcus multivorans DSM 2059 TaxID=1121405 RepID=S7TPV6_DESML|nr:hypothetical protein dsmv_0396 [Desulfococcus multivorans DSM 2059]
MTIGRVGIADACSEPDSLPENVPVVINLARL